MGPYSRGTTQGVGAFFDMLYEYPVLILLLAAGIVGAGLFYWYKKKLKEEE